MGRISEKELILPSLLVMSNKENGEITTTELIRELEELIEVGEEDNGIIFGRNDTYFSQKVRNLKSHKTLERKDFATYENGKYKITEKGEEHLAQNQEQLSLAIEEEKFLEKYSIVISEYYAEFNQSIENIKQLLDAAPENEPLQTHYFNMLFSSVITSLETYLADGLKFHMAKNKDYLIIFVETFKDFKNQKCDLSNIFDLYNSVESKVDDELRSLLYHNLPKIMGIYKSTFDIDFKPINELMNAISIRHDLVHRNGKKPDGTAHNISKEDILGLCEKTSEFVNYIEEQFNMLNQEEN